MDRILMKMTKRQKLLLAFTGVLFNMVSLYCWLRDGIEGKVWWGFSVLGMVIAFYFGSYCVWGFFAILEED